MGVPYGSPLACWACDCVRRDPTSDRQVPAMSQILDGSDPCTGGGDIYLSPDWTTPDPGAVELCQMSWKAPVAWVRSMTSVGSMDTPSASADVYRLTDVYPSQAATLFLLGGGTLSQLFDGTMVLAASAPWRETPLLLVAADFPRLIPPPHYIREVVVARIRKLTGNPPTGTVRSEIFSAAMAEGLFKPKVSCTPNVQQ